MLVRRCFSGCGVRSRWSFIREILLFLISGIYNAVRNWHTYNQWPGITHGLFGLHLLLALTVFIIWLILLAGPRPIQIHARWMMINIVLLFVTVAVASTLKWAAGVCARSSTHQTRCRVDAAVIF